MITFVIILAAYIRLRLNLQSSLIPGVNGGYYALMTRGLLENGQLPFSDFPLSFWILGGISKILNLFIHDPDRAILFSCKLADGIIPSLAALPVWFLAKKRNLPALPGLLAAALIVLYFPSSYLMTGEMFKNALGVLWLTMLLAALATFNQKLNLQTFSYLLLSFILLALTHFGSLLTGLLFLPLIIQALIRWIKKSPRLSGLNIFFLLPLLMISPDQTGRWGRFLSVSINPLRLFEHPVMFYLFDGQAMYSKFIMAYALLTHLLALLFLGIAIRKKSVIWWAFVSVFLTSPLLGVEWYLRLVMMAHIPIAIGLVLLWKPLSGQTKQLTVGILSILILTSVFLGLTGHRKRAVSRDGIANLKEIAAQKIVEKNDLVVATHGMEWWTGWFLNCHIAQQQAVSAQDLLKYKRILGLRHKETVIPGVRRGQLNFEDPYQAPVDITLFDGNNLVLFKMDPIRLNHLPEGHAPVAKGRVIRNNDGTFVLEGQLHDNPLRLDTAQEKALLQLTTDQQIMVFGRKRAFSLQIVVDSILSTSPGI